MNFKSTIIIGVAIIIAAIIISSTTSTNLPNLESMEYSDFNNHDQSINGRGDSWNETTEQGQHASFTKNMNRSSTPKTTKTSQVSANYNSSAQEGNTKDEIVFKPIMDLKRGIPSLYFPLPSSWKVKNEGWYGPKGLEVKQLNSIMMDFQQEPYQSPEQLLNNGEIANEIRKSGGRISDVKRINAISKAEQNYGRLNAISNDYRLQNEAVGFTIHTNGKKSYGILKTTSYTHQFGGGWIFTLIGLDANASYIDKANEHLIYAYSNFKPNMQQIAMYKAEEIKKSNKSWSDHNNRMRNNQKNFNVSNKAIVDANNATNDAIVGTYNSSSASFDRMNQSQINGIYGENTVSNPYDGTQHQTNDMYDRTFMNSFGEQIQTNDQFYQPGMDPNAIGYEEVYPNSGY